MDREASNSPVITSPSSPGCRSPKTEADRTGDESCGCSTGEVSCRCPVIQYPLYPSLYSSVPATSNLLLSPSLEASYRMKDGAETWRALCQAVSYSHPHLAYHPYNNTNVDVTSSRRKNATRESTSTLKAWLHEHLKNPYPTKGEKIMLAIITKMTLTQVSTWFANARRRLKKENKMTWSSRHRGDDDDSDQEEAVDSWKNTVKIPETLPEHNDGDRAGNERLRNVLDLVTRGQNVDRRERNETGEKVDGDKEEVEKKPVPEKPKIWSLVDTATSVSPVPKPARPAFPCILPAHLSYLLPAYHSLSSPSCYS